MAVPRHHRRRRLSHRRVGLRVARIPAERGAYEGHRGQAVEEDAVRLGGDDRSQQRLPLWYPPLDEEEAEHDRGEASRAESRPKSSTGRGASSLNHYAVADRARRVGSVGTRCFILLLLGRDFDDPLFLQVREAGPPALEALGETRRATASIAEIEGLLWRSFHKSRNGSGASQDAATLREYRYLTLRFSKIVSGP